MIKPNWDIFRAKFSNNPQDNFEWFSYLLFCKEFNHSHGVFRYKNQSGIETNPINFEGKNIGWQAKFYDSPLSKHKNDFINALNKTKRDYPEVTNLYFYTNQEWGQYRGNKPKGLKEVEKLAKELNIILDWKTASYFESEFVSVKNEIISKYFFSLDKSILDLIFEQQKHTESILDQIKTNIIFNNQTIKIDRTEYLEKLNTETHQTFILSGVGGVGKTVLVKDLYQEIKEHSHFYIFKATEFEISNINNLFSNFSFYDFIDAHKDSESKVIVIDSSEKLLDLNNSDPFLEFLSSIIQEKWKVIFTSRDYYLEDLNYQFFEIYNITPLNLSINNLEIEELKTISGKHSFPLPNDEKVLDLIRNPFYLNEYLKIYNDDETEKNYREFKKALWNNNIRKSKPERERCFLNIAFERANKAHFFINPDPAAFSSSVLDDELVGDGILGYEATGYFITHDIYEEWALEKVIENEFIKKKTNESFFENIGQSLPIRRSFRSWVSEKLLMEDSDIKTFIEEVTDSETVASFWKDEMLVSVLLSDYSKLFFDTFKEKLLGNEQALLKKISFILRIACKEIDDALFKSIDINHINIFSLKYVLTKPKGRGWENIIQFVFDNLGTIGIKNINFILPVINDWNSKVKKGRATRLSGLISLQYYQWIIDENIYFHRDNSKELLLHTILYGSAEIKDELINIFDDILSHKWSKSGDPYYELSKLILTKPEGLTISYVLPKHVLKLADLFWTKNSEKRNSTYYSHEEAEDYFGLNSSHSDYHPASAFQTPIYCLLIRYPNATINFIIDFTNKAVEFYSKSTFDNTVEKVEVHNKDEITKQYSSHCLWSMYRGTGSPRSPYVLQSIHMALEKFLLELGKKTNPKILNDWLLYLLEKSCSSSISSVVTSIVLAFPEETFDVAIVLFKTKQFFLNDSSRWVSEQGAKSLYEIGLNITGQTDMYADERISTCEDKHRKWTLEHLFLNYQCFRSKDTNEDEATRRQHLLWELLDHYYQELPSESEQKDSDKTWRLFLSRMDKRIMDITTEESNDGFAIQFNPKLDSDLKDYSEESLSKHSEVMKHSSLKRWAEYKFSNDEKYKQFNQYEDNPQAALDEVKDILQESHNIDTSDLLKLDWSDEEYYFMLNNSIPSYVCSVLIRDHFDDLSKEDNIFCKNLILYVANSSLSEDYHYQIFDGVQPIISVLPILLKAYPEEKEDIKIILLLSLFNEDHVGGIHSHERFSIFALNAITKLWVNNFDDAQSLLLGYTLLKPRRDELCKVIREESYSDGFYKFNKTKLLEKFIEENEGSILNMVENKLTYELDTIYELDLHTLKTIFQLIPIETTNNDHKIIVKTIISVFADKLLSDDREDKIDYITKHDFFEKYAYFVLKSPENEIHDYLQPFIDNFTLSESLSDLLNEFVIAEDILNSNSNFWLVWELFKPKIIQACTDSGKYSRNDDVIKSYLFARVPWKKTAKEWHSFQFENKRFFKQISDKIGHCPATVYSISKLLNDIGSHYLDDGVFWISNMLHINQESLNKKLHENTIYYIENIVRKYIFQNREKIKRTKLIKDEILITLDFLIEQGSVIGYLLRERII